MASNNVTPGGTPEQLATQASSLQTAAANLAMDAAGEIYSIVHSAEALLAIDEHRCNNPAIRALLSRIAELSNCVTEAVDAPNQEELDRVQGIVRGLTGMPALGGGVEVLHG